MDKFSPDQLWNACLVILALLGVVVLLGNVWKVVKDWRKPHDDTESWRRDVDSKLNRDNGRLNDLEEGNKVICRGILAMLSHEINGNSSDKLLASQQEITNYLINR